MNKKISLFKCLVIETQSTCNRRCPGCLRSSSPNRDVVASWFRANRLLTEDYEQVLKGALKMGFRGDVCLSYYDEPLMDDRICELAKRAKSLGFQRVFLCSNGDLLNEEIAGKLDEALDDIAVTLYLGETQFSEHSTWVKSLFKRISVLTVPGAHILTHYSPLGDVVASARQNCENPCIVPLARMIINHKGEMCMCCDDLVNNFDLGTIHEYSIEELWYGERHQELVLSLQNRGGRKIHPYCLSCPRSGTNY